VLGDRLRSYSISKKKKERKKKTPRISTCSGWRRGEGKKDY